jgi:VIT1/CCC1 family predicted Fe2+/Mn2+ transporter
VLEANGAALPLGVVAFYANPHLAAAVAISALVALAVLGALVATAGGANLLPCVMRVSIWSALAPCPMAPAVIFMPTIERSRLRETLEECQ